jgi:predicted ATP-grasp superfamily ATP-dependent carboligase
VAGSPGDLRAPVVLAEAIGRSGLAVARSLSRRGIPFIAVGHEPKGIVAASRHTRRYVEAPSPDDDPGAFLDVVLDACVKHDARLVMPIVDASLAVCSEHRALLPTLAAPGAESVRNVLDKRLNLATASRLGVRCPAGLALERVDQIPDLTERIGYPMVLKNPGWGPDGSRPAHAFKWQIARDERELRTLLAEHSGNGPFPLFQELVEGVVTNLCCFVAAGRIVAAQQYRSVRRLAWAGTAVLREIVEPDPRRAGVGGRRAHRLRRPAE